VGFDLWASVPDVSVDVHFTMHVAQLHSLLLVASAGLFAPQVVGFSTLHRRAGHVNVGHAEKRRSGHIEKRVLGLPVPIPIVEGVGRVVEGAVDLPLGSQDGCVDVTGEHEWRAPREGEQRGPCVR
jgi:hypothetical protein